MSTPRGAWPLIVAAVLGAGLLLVPTASAKIKAPAALSPASGVKALQMPVFSWGQVKTADHYEFQLAADKGFNSIVATDGKQVTKNTAVSVAHALVNSTYWWRVRSVTATNATSKWTKSRSIVLRWAPVTTLTSPADGTPFNTPAASASVAPVLRWAAMPGAAQYAVSIASDPLLGTLVTPNAAPEITDGTAYTLNATLPDNTYFWSVTPIDPEGHKGLPSAVRSFSVRWNASAGSPTVTDLADGEELMDPLFSWSSVLGAASYGLEISTSADFAAGSKVCCDGKTTGISYSPKSLLQNNTYYWRVQPFTSGGASGAWTVGAPFSERFDNVSTPPSVKNLRMRDVSDIGSDPGASPIVTWDAVLGASKYEVEIDHWIAPSGGNPGVCNTSDRWGDFTTGVTAWTPLGNFGGSAPSIGNANNPSVDSNFLGTSGTSFCVQVRAINTDQDGNAVFGDWTLMNNGTSPAFTTDAGTPTSNPTCGGYLCPGNYLSPIGGVDEKSTPALFVWKPVANVEGYFIVISKDPSFSNILDYAFTSVSAYAPRRGNGVVEYADESAGSPLYWAVLPVHGGAPTAPAANLATSGNPQSFDKASDAPLLYPAAQDGAGISFHWTPMLGAADYTIQVSTDGSFSSLLENVITDSASYTAATSYPAGGTLWYRVRANDAQNNGLAWAVGSFNRTLAAPVPSAPNGDINPVKLDGVPTMSWAPVAGAVSYDIHVDKSDGTSQDQSVIPPTVSWLKFNGPGVWKWKVRAEFGTNGGQTIPGPYSTVQTFTRTFGEPVGARAVLTKTRLLFSWNPKQGAKLYRLQVATDADFASLVDDVSQDASHFAPTLTNAGYVNGGRLFWHVAAIDAEGNQGDWTATAKVSLAKGLKVAASGSPVRGKASSVTVVVTNVKGVPVKGVTVRVSGAGALPRSKKTNKKGLVVLRVRPTSIGALVFNATKQGYQLGSVTATIS